MTPVLQLSIQIFSVNFRPLSHHLQCTGCNTCVSGLIQVYQTTKYATPEMLIFLLKLRGQPIKWFKLWNGGGSKISSKWPFWCEKYFGTLSVLKQCEQLEENIFVDTIKKAKFSLDWTQWSREPLMIRVTRMCLMSLHFQIFELGWLSQEYEYKPNKPWIIVCEASNILGTPFLQIYIHIILQELFYPRY